LGGSAVMGAIGPAVGVDAAAIAGKA